MNNPINKRKRTSEYDVVQAVVMIKHLKENFTDKHQVVA